jgi:hypothetical protein
VTGTISAPRCVFKTILSGYGCQVRDCTRHFPRRLAALWHTIGGDTAHRKALEDQHGIVISPPESPLRFDRRPEMFTCCGVAQTTRCGGLTETPPVEVL